MSRKERQEKKLREDALKQPPKVVLGVPSDPQPVKRPQLGATNTTSNPKPATKATLSSNSQSLLHKNQSFKK